VSPLAGSYGAVGVKTALAGSAHKTLNTKERKIENTARERAFEAIVFIIILRRETLFMPILPFHRLKFLIDIALEGQSLSNAR
jgi:hypothetical protein